MNASKRLSLSLNPLWPHYASALALIVSLLVGLSRFIFFDRHDPNHCQALLNNGRWLDETFRNWQPEGCMLRTYKPADASVCLASKNVVFIGDSVTRKLYFQFANLVDPSLPTAPPDDDQKHSDHKLRSKDGTSLTFVWDPFLNTIGTHNFIHLLDESGHPFKAPAQDRPALMVLGSGLWYLRYSNTSGGLPAWEAQMESYMNVMSTSQKPADEVVVLPVEDVVPSKLSPERAASMHSSDIDAMNSDLFHRIGPVADPYTFLSPIQPSVPISLPVVFNQMLDSSQTDDGLHFSDKLVKAQANLLLNLRCNEFLPKKFPMDHTCCSSYPWPSAPHLAVLFAVFMWGPLAWFFTQRKALKVPIEFAPEHIPPLVFSGSLALIYAADRTGLWSKEQKQFDAWTFGFLNFFALAVGLLTIKRADKDMGFLNRDQTDEWKGWMQVAILIYHYFGASQISGIYNPIRVLVASYLFMTGYGHTIFYIKKADFGFLRIAQVLVRLNIYTLLLAYVMNTDYMFYYFAPLVSTWFLIVYATMVVGHQLNDRAVFVLCKIIVSMGLVTWFMSESWLMEILFEFLAQFCSIRWSAREWAFRLNLDLWIVYFGMLAALGTLKAREHRWTDRPLWAPAVKAASVLSIIVLLWYFAFELSQPDKFAYNAWHPFVSFLPIGAFVVLRNATPVLRSASSRAFAFIGQCSLETFIIQYHLWLAGDTKGILMVFTGAYSRPLNMIITSIVFLYISHQVSQATGVVTSWICGSSKQTLPTITTAPSTSSHPNISSPATASSEAVPLMEEGRNRKERAEEPLPPEPDTPARPVNHGWADRLSASTSQQSSPPTLRLWYGEGDWRPGVRTRLALGICVMWLMNVIWPASSR